MKYIGNIPGFEITQLQQGNFDFVAPSDPTVDINPSTIPVTWLNLTTGETFICIDNTPGANVWVRAKSSRTPRALLYLGSDYTLGNNVNSAVPFDSVAYDTGGFTDPSDLTKLVIPENVLVVRLTAKIRWNTSSGNGYRLSDIAKNGSRVYIGAAVMQTSGIASSSEEHNLVTAPLEVVPGDVFHLDVRQSSGSPALMDQSPTGTWLAIEALEWD